MKNKVLALLVFLFLFAANAQQISWFNQGFLQQQNAAQDLAWLGIGGTNKGLGTVTNFTATGFPPLFSSSVTTPTTYPHLTFTALPVGSNVVYAGPDAITGLPTFRRLTTNDLPPISSGGTGTVTSVGLTGPSEFSYGPPVTTSGNLSFTRSADANFLGFGAFNMGFLRVTNLGTFGGLWVTNGITNAGPLLVQGGATITGTAGINVTYQGTFGGLLYNGAGYGDENSDGGWFSAYLGGNNLVGGPNTNLTYTDINGRIHIANIGSGLSWDVGTETLSATSGGGTVTSFSSGNLSPLFTTTVATPTTTPALSYTLSSQSANTVFAGPTSGGSSSPTFRALVAGDIPSLSGTYLPLAGGTMSGTINLASGGVNFGSTPMFQDSANAVAMRNGTTAQTLEIYNTFTDASNYRRGFLGWSGADFHVGTQSAGTGTGSGNLSIDVAGTHRIIFRANSTDLWTILDPTAGGTILPLTDNAYDIGENSTPRRPKNIYAAGQIIAPEIFMDTLSGATSDNIGMVGNIVLDPTSGQGNIQDHSGNTLIDANGNFFGNGAGMSGVVLSITNAGRGASDVTLITSSNASTPSLKALSPGTGMTFTDRGTDIVLNASSSGSVVSITNASLNVDPTRITMIGNSNAPIPSIKSISAGTGTTLTDQGTNVVISSTATGTVLSITNATGGVGANPGTTLIGNSNAPIPSIKSLTAGSSVTFADTPTNITISVTVPGATATNLNDLYMTNLTAFQNNSNYFIDFSFPSATLTSATNVIAFNYSTNWGLANTSRVCNILVPATNFGRIVTFANAATNWHIMPMVYFIPLGYNARFFATQWGQGETNVTISPYIESTLTTSNTTASFNPTNVFPNSGGLGTKLWLDASTKAWQDEWLTVPSIDGAVVRGWTDLSGFVPAVTNMITTELNTFYRTPMTGPLNVPCMRIYPGQSGAFCWLQSQSYTAITAPIWGFIMYYGRSGGVVVDANSGTRFAINPAEMGQTSSFFCSAGLTYTAAKTVNWTLVACCGNGASSFMRTNGVQATSGNAGTPSPSQWMVFGDNVKSVQVGEYNVAEILVLATNLSNTQLTNVESYFYRKYPFWNPPTVQ